MPSNKEIMDRINSIKDTRKITNAMYLISSSKYRKAKKNQDRVSEYFHDIRITIKKILLHMPEMEHAYLDSGKKKMGIPAYIVITADKGLAGAYNQNVIKLAEEELIKNPEARIFAVGQIGRHYFMKKHPDNIEADFLYSAQDPTLQRARNITAELIDLYRSKNISEIHLIYTRMKNALQTEALNIPLIPLSREIFFREGAFDDKRHYINEDNSIESFFPSENAVFNQLAPISMQGIIFSALTESYCAELNDRMNAMDSASKNADEMIADLELLYNRTRQGSITQEITEVIAGSKAQKKKKLS